MDKSDERTLDLNRIQQMAREAGDWESIFQVMDEDLPALVAALDEMAGVLERWQAQQTVGIISDKLWREINATLARVKRLDPAKAAAR